MSMTDEEKSAVQTAFPRHFVIARMGFRALNRFEYGPRLFSQLDSFNESMTHC
jgi:hypothetical protein